jgi:hypothetical protein
MREYLTGAMKHDPKAGIGEAVDVEEKPLFRIR